MADISHGEKPHDGPDEAHGGGGMSKPMRQNREEVPVIFICSTCGTSFSRHYNQSRRRAARPQYCSGPCQSAAKARYALEKQAARIWGAVLVASPDDCWEWQAHRDKRGYGRTRFNRRYGLAHRAVYQLVHGPIPDGLLVCHECDNPPCCNPAHLWPGTQKQNMQDAGQKRRAGGLRLHGERHPDAKITDTDAVAIFHSVESGPVLAARYGVTKEAINMIRRGVNWARVTGARDV